MILDHLADALEQLGGGVAEQRGAEILVQLARDMRERPVKGFVGRNQHQVFTHRSLPRLSLTWILPSIP